MTCNQENRASAAQEKIRLATSEAITNKPWPDPFTIKDEVSCEVIFTKPLYVDSACLLPFVKRLDGRTVGFSASNYLEAFQIFRSIEPLSRAFD